MKKNSNKIYIFILFIACLFVCNNKKTVFTSTVNNRLVMAGNGYIFNSEDVNFSDSSLSSKNVKSAVDELKSSIDDGCKAGYAKGTESGGTYSCNKITIASDQTEVFDSANVKYDNSNGLTSSNVKSAIIELASMIPDCKTNYNKTNVTSNSYECKKTCVPPSNITIGTDKSITWTNSATASSYKVCVASGDDVCTPNIEFTSGSTLNAIVNELGSRTLYAASVCDSSYYTTISDIGSASTTVYGVTLVPGTGINTVNGAGNYITGSTVTLGATIKNGYTWNKWTNTTSGTEVSTSNAHVFTISNNVSYTANAVANYYTVALDANGGTIPATTGWTVGTNAIGLSYASKSIQYDSVYGLPTPTREGYTFNGWYTSDSVGNITIPASTNQFNYTAIKYNLYSGVTYTITMNSATLTSGTATSFTTLVYDLTSSLNLVSVNNSFSNSNLSYNITVPDTADSSHDLRILIYAGISGSTANNEVVYSNVKVGTVGNTNDNLVGSSTTLSFAGTHQLIAKWTINKVYIRYHVNGGTWAGSTNSNLGVTDSYVTYNGNSTTAFSVNYGGTLNLANYNNPDYINISKSLYKGSSGSEWCTGTSGNGTCYNHNTDYTNVGTDATASTHFCDARVSSCTVTLYVNWVLSDTTKPSCTWGTAPVITSGSTGTITLTCTDAGSGISTSTLATSAFTVGSGLTVSSVSAPTAVTNGKRWTLTLSVSSVGSKSLSLKAGSVSDGSSNTNAATSTTVTGKGTKTVSSGISAINTKYYYPVINDTGSTVTVTITLTGRNTYSAKKARRITITDTVPAGGTTVYTFMTWVRDSGYVGVTHFGKIAFPSGSNTGTATHLADVMMSYGDGTSGHDAGSIGYSDGTTITGDEASTRINYSIRIPARTSLTKVSSWQVAPTSGNVYYDLKRRKGSQLFDAFNSSAKDFFYLFSYGNDVSETTVPRTSVAGSTQTFTYGAATLSFTATY